MADGSAGLVCLFDRVEAHDNPVSLIAEAKRLVGDGTAGAVLAVSKTPPLQHDQPLHPYRPPMPLQMANLVKAVTGWRTMMEVQQQSPGVPMVALSTDRPLAQPGTESGSEQVPMTLEPAAAS